MDWTTNFDLVKEEKKNLENKIAFHLFSFAFKSSPLLQPSNSEPSIIHHHFPSPQKPSDRESVYNIYQTHSRINSEGEVWLICIPLQLEEASKGIALIPNLRFINFFFLSFLNIWDHAIPLDSSFGGFYYFSCFSWTTTTSSPTNCILHIKHSATIPNHTPLNLAKIGLMITLFVLSEHG
ncbi:hypothetical protein ACSQ67_017285 [Phaseolus vulgaris]